MGRATEGAGGFCSPAKAREETLLYSLGIEGCVLEAADTLPLKDLGLSYSRSNQLTHPFAVGRKKLPQVATLS